MRVMTRGRWSKSPAADDPSIDTRRRRRKVETDSAGRPDRPLRFAADMARHASPAGTPQDDAADRLPAIVTGMIRAVIVEAGPQQQPRSRLRHLLDATGRVDVIDTASSGISAVEAIRRLAPDAVFARLPSAGRTSLEVAEAIAASTFTVVIAPDDAHAVEAFRVGAVDFLVEPFDLPRLMISVHRLERLIGLRRQHAAATEGPPPDAAPQPVIFQEIGPLSLEDRIPLTSSETRTTEIVAVARIVWIESLENYSRVQLSGGVRLVLKRSLAVWEEMLPAGFFQRLGRSLIIQEGRIRSASWKGRSAHVVFDGVPKPLVVGRAAADRLRKLLKPRDGG